MKTITLLVLAFLLSLSACTYETHETPPPEEEGEPVYLQLDPEPSCFGEIDEPYTKQNQGMIGCQPFESDAQCSAQVPREESYECCLEDVCLQECWNSEGGMVCIVGDACIGWRKLPRCENL